MKKSIFVIGVIILLILSQLFTSCVSTKKFMSSKARTDSLRKDSILTHSQLKDCNAEVANLKADKASLKKENAEAQKELKSLSAEKDSIENVKEQAEEELQSLSKESNKTIAEKEMRLQKLEDVIESEKSAMQELKNTLSNALMNYKNNGLSVYLKNGNVHVSLAEKLLFKSGSDVVDSKGRTALKSLADVLNKTKNINVLIEGNTDSVPIKTMRYKDNWDLSTDRATSVVRILLKDGFDAKRITAAGRGKYNPVETNKTAAGRAINRRTDVILSPDLSELYKLVGE